MLRTAGAFVTAMLLACTNSKALVLVENGQPRATIVVAADQPHAQKAAEEIQIYVEKISGATLPIVKEGQPLVHQNSILVGHTEAAQKLGVKIPSGFNPAIRPDAFEEEGYVLQTRGNQLIVGGNSDGPYQGTLYAAYALLEKLGCRWYFPGEWGEVVPQSNNVVVPELDITSKPDFAMRFIWINGRWLISAEDRALYKPWTVRVGFSDNTKLYVGPGDGYLGIPLPPKQYAQSNPEFYAMDKGGRRKVTPEAHPQHTMLCLTNEQLQVEYIKNIKEAFEGKRSLDNVKPQGLGISPPDGAPYCYCEKCVAASQNFNYPTYIHERMQSEEVFAFGCKLADVFPDKWVSVSAYALREMPPQGVKLRPNMGVMYAPISSCILHPNNDPSCWRRQETTKILTQWCRQTAHVWLYDYTPGFLITQFVPERDVANFAINAPIYKQIGLKGFMREGSNSMMASWISYYTAAKLMWDVNVDVAALKRDFYDTFLGAEAGPHVQAWWDACEDVLLKGTIHPHEDWLINHIYTVEFARSIRPHVEAARRAAMSDAQRARFKVFELIVENFEASAEMEEADRNLDYEKAAASAARILAAREALHQISVYLIGKLAQERADDIFTKGRMIKYQRQAEMINGKKGVLIGAVPLETAFRRDRFNEGVVAEWYAPQLDTSGWETKNTFYTWEAQDPPEDAAGHDYDGYGWYRFTIDVPAEFKGRPAKLYLGGVINEGWVWVNGEYAGHRAHKIWWTGGHEFDVDVTKLLRAGESNTISIRVWNDADVGGLYRRGFLWSPHSNENP